MRTVPLSFLFALAIFTYHGSTSAQSIRAGDTPEIEVRDLSTLRKQILDRTDRTTPTNVKAAERGAAAVLSEIESVRLEFESLAHRARFDEARALQKEILSLIPKSELGILNAFSRNPVTAPSVLRSFQEMLSSVAHISGTYSELRASYLDGIGAILSQHSKLVATAQGPAFIQNFSIWTSWLVDRRYTDAETPAVQRFEGVYRAAFNHLMCNRQFISTK